MLSRRQAPPPRCRITTLGPGTASLPFGEDAEDTTKDKKIWDSKAMVKKSAAKEKKRQILINLLVLRGDTTRRPRRAPPGASPCAVFRYRLTQRKPTSALVPLGRNLERNETVNPLSLIMPKPPPLRTRSLPTGGPIGSGVGRSRASVA